MKLVTLLGSPRTKGNSAAIANRFTDTAAQLGAETRTYELNRLAYQGCQGCYACKREFDECVIEDDLTRVLAEVREADCVVLASPVYFGQGNPDEDMFADVFPGYDRFLKWLGFGDTRLIRACGIGPASVDAAPEPVLRQAEEAARAIVV